ncbi:transferase [Lithospermum erythrorhizon]|uniref:Transferase n=1 Tax=Lithospermum erythrorhizon TaxID=34254 RepID=A0AAV3R8A3_LITER
MMLGLHVPAGLMMNLAGHANLSKEMHCLVCVFSGFMMCKIVYDITGVISPLFFKEYAKLSSAQKIEWNNRGFSTFHAIAVAVVSLYLLLVSDLFSESSQSELIVNRTSNLSDSILGVSVGYFLSDLAMILYHFPALGGMEYMLHHGLSMFAIIQSIISGQAVIYILMVLFTESTTPFVNLRWYLDVAGKKSSKLYIGNGVALFFGWLVARILLFIYFFFHMYVHFDQVKKIYPFGFYSVLTVPPALAVMNVVWFWKISRGLVKTLKKARYSA